MKIDDESKKRLIRTYEAFYENAIEIGKTSSLSNDELKAIGERVVSEIVEKAMNGASIPIEKRDDLTNEIRKCLIDNSKYNIWDSSVIYNNKSNSKNNVFIRKERKE